MGEHLLLNYRLYQTKILTNHESKITREKSFFNPLGELDTSERGDVGAEVTETGSEILVAAVD